MENEMQREFSLTWIIENYFLSCADEIMKSPIFYPNTFDNSEWLVVVQLKFNSLSCLLVRMKNSELQVGEIRNDFEIEIIDKDDKVCVSKKFKNSQAFKGPDLNSPIDTIVGIVELIKYSEQGSFTVRCHFLHADQPRKPKRECIIKTRFAQERYSFEWKVKLQDTIQKQKFQFQNDVYEAILDTRKDNFDIKIQRDSEGVFRFWGCALSLLESEGSQKATKTAIFKLKGKNKVMKFQDFLSKDTLKKNKCLENGNFTLKWELFVSNGTPSSDIEYKYTRPGDISPVVSPPSIKTRDDLQRMYYDKVFSDIKFRIGDEMLSAHKGILCVHSAVFLAMFSQDMTERQTGVVDILDSDVKTFDVFLKYFYCGTIADMDYEVAVKLIKLADKYEVQPLVAMCSPVLASNLSEETAFEILLTADAVQNTDLKTMAIRFIKERASDILNSDQWKEFIKSNIDLATEIITYK